MKLTAFWGLSLFALLGLAACGDAASSLCDQQQTCAEKAGQAFSRTECENNYQVNQEKSDTKGCGDQYDELLSCTADIDFECSDNVLTKVNSECGAQVQKYAKCML